MEQADELLAAIRALGSEHNRAGMARFGINTARAVGASMAQLRPLAKTLGVNQPLADALWASAVHEARILACFLADPKAVSRASLDAWALDLDSWDVCDQFCNKLVVKTPHAWAAAAGWAGRQQEFVRRAGFSLMAQLAVHDKRASDEAFLPLLALVARHATDERNFVKKAVNWALRQIGKRNRPLGLAALALCEELVASGSKPARWIGLDARRELLTRV